MTGFDDYHLHKSLARGLDNAGYENPSALQGRMMEAALEGRDIVALASYGTGRLAAHLLPTLDRLLSHFGARRPRAIILVPGDREALRVREETEFLLPDGDIRVASLFGTTGQANQRRALDSGVDMIVATPAAFLDHLDEGLDLAKIEVWVIDGIDRISLDPEGIEDLKEISEALPEEHQTLLLCDGLDGACMSLVRNLVNDPLQVEVSTGAPAQGLRLDRIEVAKDKRLGLLRRLLKEESMKSVMIFGRGNRTAERIRRSLARENRIVRVVTGAMDEADRIRAREDFQEGKADILIGTDEVAAELVVYSHSHVINYDLPDSYEEFVDRVGRRGLPPRAPVATSFFTPDDRKLLATIEKGLGYKLEELKVANFDRGLGRGRSSSRRRGRRGGNRQRQGSSGSKHKRGKGGKSEAGTRSTRRSRRGGRGGSGRRRQKPSS